MNRKELKEEEYKFLLAESQKYPELFKKATFIDDSLFLEKIGISLPQEIKKHLSFAYFKLWPEDFIVEEVQENEEICTIDLPQGKESVEGVNLSQEGSTVYATLVKCGLSTIEAIEELSSILKIDKRKVKFAGIKDKNALTAQKISFRGIGLQALKTISSPYFFLKDFFIGKRAMETGRIKGNRFIVFLRTNEFFQEKNFWRNLEIIGKEGFFNFFYSQRFGSPRFINWFWGLLIFKGEYQKAIISYLTAPGLREILYFQKLREKIGRYIGDWQKIQDILSPFPILFQNEIKVVNHLKEKPDDFIGALNQISEQIQLWVFAYVSLLFNRRLSYLINENLSLPDKLPLILSKDKKDWQEYSEFLVEDGIYNIPFKNLKPFKFIQWAKREIETKKFPQIHKVKIIPEGVVLSFTLDKGSYATTFLSHLFQLISGLPPKNISTKRIDCKEILEEGNIKDVINRFEELTETKNFNIFY